MVHTARVIRVVLILFAREKCIKAAAALWHGNFKWTVMYCTRIHDRTTTTQKQDLRIAQAHFSKVYLAFLPPPALWVVAHLLSV